MISTNQSLMIVFLMTLTFGPITLKAQSRGKVQTPKKVAAPVTKSPSARRPASAAAAAAPGAPAAQAPAAATNRPAGLSGGGGEAKALEVRGQARSLQMMMLLKGKGDDIHFVKPRKDFRPEVNTTTY